LVTLTTAKTQKGAHMTERHQEIQAALQAAVQPVLEQLEQLEQEIKGREAELADLRKLRTRTKQIAHSLDPEQPAGRGQRPKKGKASLKAAPETVDKIYLHLQEHVPEGETFSGPGLMDNGFDLTSYATLNAALLQLQEQGRIRLDKVDKQGGRRIWKLT
jgi:hypothetical protein